ncbi:alcohol dehydrogenase catalytic domain-containing protein, partial [Xanthobacter autotrophicus]
MKAARFHARRDVRVEDIPAPPDQPGPRQVLVKNRFCGICGTDLHEYAAGPIGQLQVLAARAAGATRIFLSD